MTNKQANGTHESQNKKRSELLTVRDDSSTVGLFKIPSSNPLLKVKKKKRGKETKIEQIKREKEHKQI